MGEMPSSESDSRDPGVSVWSTDLPSSAPPPVEPPLAASVPASEPPERRVRGNRRAFLIWAGIVAGGAAAVAVGSRVVGKGGSGSTAARATVELPSTTATLPNQLRAGTGATELPVEGITPLITPTAEFFRIDAAFAVPQVDLSTWKLQISGAVRTPLSFSFDDLLAMAQVTAPVTIACVSNEVGGKLVGTAVWQGVPLSALLDRAGVQPGGEQIVGRSLDGFTAGFPVDAATDGRTALVAIGMNGDPLPVEHGFPARLIVEGLYGYVSATKWLSSIELRGWSEFDGYWIDRGWSKTGPIKMSARIDTPRAGAKVAAGPIGVGGVAWAPDSGVAAVEVQVDDGPWQRATLGESLSNGVWRQWRLDWNSTPGSHRIQARTVNGDGEVQTGEVSQRQFDGETGWHSREVTVG
jgi:DMSO/TMAO reductase YedYZ molybdopterin-dependent catalytic subunit